MKLYVVYAKFNGKWFRKKAFETEREARIEMQKQVYLWYAEAATVEVEEGELK